MRPVDEAAAVADLGAARDHTGHPGPRRHRGGLGGWAGLLPARPPQPPDLPAAPLPRAQGRDEGVHLAEYRDILVAAHSQLPGGNIVLVWDNLSVHTCADLRAFTSGQPWLRVFQLPAYTPDLNPVEGIWSVLMRGVLANLAVASFAHLVQVIRHGLKKIQYQPGLIEGCLAGTGLALEPLLTQRTS